MRVLIAVAGLLILALGLWRWSIPSSGLVEGEGAAVRSGAGDSLPARATRRIDRAQVASDGPKLDDREREDEVENESLGPVIVSGVCVNQHERPVSGVEILVSRRVMGSLEEPVWRALDLGRRVVTGTRGEFQIRVPRVAIEFELTARFPFLLREEFEISKSKHGDLGELTVSRGYRVAGRVVDRAGKTVDAAWIQLDGRVVPIRDGAFDFGSVAEAQGERLSSPDQRFQVLSPMPLAIGPNHDTSAVRVVVEPLSGVSGVLRDEQGRPVSGRLLVGVDNEYARTGPDGSFFMSVGSRMDQFQRFLDENNRNEDGYVETSRWFRCPAEGVSLTLRRWDHFQLRVLDPAGDLVPQFEFLRRKGPGSFGSIELRQHAGGSSGTTIWSGVPRGQQSFRIRSADGKACSSWFQLNPEDWMDRPKVVHLEPLVPLRVRMEGGEGLEGWSAHYWVQRGQPRFFWCHGELVQGVVDLYVPQSIAGGWIELSSLKARAREQLTLHHERTREVRFSIPSTPDVGSFEMVVPPKSVRAARRLSSSLELRNAKGDRKSILGFRVSAVPVGDWSVIRTKGYGRPTELLGVVRIEAKETTRFAWTPPPSCSFRAEMMHRGKPCAEMSIQVIGEGIVVRASTDKKGRLDVENLPPGSYWVMTEVPTDDLGPRRFWTFAVSHQIQLGVTDRVRLSTREPAKLRVLEASGVPASNRWFQVWRYGEVQADGDGTLTLDPPPDGEIVVETMPGPGESSRRAKAFVDPKRVVEVTLPK